MASVIVRTTTKLIEDGHRGLQVYMLLLLRVYVFKSTFFQNQKAWLFCRVPQFLEQCSEL